MTQSCLHLVEHTSLLQQLSKKGRWQQAWDSQAHLSTRRIHGDQMSCTSLLKSLRHPGRWDLALSFCSKLGHTAVRVNKFVCNALISTCTNLNAWQFGLAALICMGILRIHQDTISYNTVAWPRLPYSSGASDVLPVTIVIVVAEMALLLPGQAAGTTCNLQQELCGAERHYPHHAEASRGLSRSTAILGQLQGKAWSAKEKHLEGNARTVPYGTLVPHSQCLPSSKQLNCKGRG